MKKLRVMSVMAHQDDFEFEAAGLFLRLREYYGDNVELKVLTTSTGLSGHHVMDTDQTIRVREAEAIASADVVGAEYENLRQLDGSHIPAQVFCDRNMLGGLWNAIRAFAPDYIIAPPLVTNPLAGIHIDHQHTAEAVRLVAYQLGVPNAYPTINAPRQTRFPVPAILTCPDAYCKEALWHFGVDCNNVREKKISMLLKHKSQICEWLPFVNSLNNTDQALAGNDPLGVCAAGGEGRTGFPLPFLEQRKYSVTLDAVKHLRQGDAFPVIQQKKAAVKLEVLQLPVLLYGICISKRHRYRRRSDARGNPTQSTASRQAAAYAPFQKSADWSF